MLKKEKIFAYALKNAVEHDGKARVESILNSLFQEGLKKQNIKKIMPTIQKIVKQVNSMSAEEQQKQYLKKEKSVKKRKTREGLPELPNVKSVKGKVKIVTRMAPEPSKYIHIGHALTFLLNYVYAKKYRGKCILRFEDANPEKISKEYVDAIKHDVLKYLDIKLSKIVFVSDNIEKLYKYAEILIKKNRVYVCFCEQEKLRRLRYVGKECEHRNNDAKENMKEWKKMLAGEYKEGECSLRFKGDMSSNNYVMRDPVIFRINYTKHFRKGGKYCVWPMYDFYNAVEDCIQKITHVLRSSEFELRTELQNKIKQLLGLKKQIVVQYGRFNIIGALTKGRQIRELIEFGKYIGWDDPRLVTLRALKRRGIVKETYYEMLNHIGLSKKGADIDFNMIAAINRKIIDKKADRYFFVENPVKLNIINYEKFPEAFKIKEIKIKLHPEKNKKRTIKLNKNKDIFVAKDDLVENEGDEIRLLNLFNIKIKIKNKAEITSIENKHMKKIQWVSGGVKAKIMMPNAKFIKGIADSGIKQLKPGDIIQFERVGFVRYDHKEKVKKGEKQHFVFWFAHQ